MKNIAIPLRTSGWLRRTAFCAAATLGLSVARPAAGASYYVNDTGTEGDLWCVTPGDDTNDGLTPGTPVASLHTILGRYTLLPADTVFVDAGTYLLTSNIVVEARHSGTNNAPVTFQGLGRTTVLNRNNTSSTARGMFLQASHVRIQGLTFTGAYVGLYIDTTVSTSATGRTWAPTAARRTPP